MALFAEAKINELKQMRDVIDTRIEAIKKESGITTDFEDELQSTMSELQAIVDDRIANEDVHTLWDILWKVKAVNDKIIHGLGGLQD